MPKHVTSRTWKAEDIERLRNMVAAGISAARASVAFRRSVTGVKAQAKKLGCPFPDERHLKRDRRSAGVNATEWARFR